MKLLFKQRFFSWLDSFNIYNEKDEIIYTVEGQLSFGHRLHIYDKHHQHIATIKEEILTFLPQFKMYINDQYIGKFYKEFAFFQPLYHLEYKNWVIRGDFFEWDYQIYNQQNLVASVSKELFNFTDTYTLDIVNEEDALHVLMIVLSIDAEKCSRN